MLQALEACEIALRVNGLHASGDQLGRLRSRFLSSRRPEGLQGQESEHRLASVETVPRGTGRSRRRLPDLRPRY